MVDHRKPKGRAERNASKVAESVYSQSIRISHQGKGIAPICLTRLEQNRDAKGRTTLQAVFPDPLSGKDNRTDLTFMLSFPNISEMFTSGFLLWGASVGQLTRACVARTLKREFFSYLLNFYSTDICPEQIDDEVISGYYDHLHTMRRSGEYLRPGTIADSLGAVRQTLSALSGTKWSEISAQIIERIPCGPPGAEQRSVPVEVLSLDFLKSVGRAAESELRRHESDWARGRQLIEEGRILLRSGNRKFSRDLSVCLAALDEKYPGVIPDVKVIKSDDRRLGGAVLSAHRSHKVMKYFYPTARDLVPFVLLLALSTAFNPDTLLGLTWDRVEENADRLGSPAVKLIGEKRRATKDLVRLLDAANDDPSRFGVLRILKLLREMTSRLRGHVQNPAHANRLFLFIQQNKLKLPKSFGNSEFVGPSADQVWSTSLLRFCSDNGLANFQLRQIRQSLIDAAFYMNGDLGAAAAFGNHLRLHTTWTHYTSSGVRKRLRERIGEVLLLRERWIGTEGVIDPRLRTQAQDKGAATPGFLCFDPFSSPRPNQAESKLCTAYGECPSCPLAAAQVSDPVAVAQYLALRKAIHLGREKMSARTWMSKWAEVLNDLDALLERVPAEVAVASANFHFEMPSVG